LGRRKLKNTRKTKMATGKKEGVVLGKRKILTALNPSRKSRPKKVLVGGGGMEEGEKERGKASFKSTK